jgi:ribonuclease D
VPPFRIARSDVLLDLARRKPTSERDIRRLCGRDRASRFTSTWQRAIVLGVDDEPEPKPQAPEPPPDLAQRRAAERALTAWRRLRAEERGVDPQVVIPGHCVDDVIAALFAHRRDGSPLDEALARVGGFGAVRITRYADDLRALLESAG